MMRNFSGGYLSIFCGVLIFLPLKVGAFQVKNSDFESGNLSGWTVFETVNGTLGGGGYPHCVDFDITGDGYVSKSVEFKVGQRQYQGGAPSLAGGGIFRRLHLEQGSLSVTADIASSYSSLNDRRNLAGGLFEILLDGAVIASHDFGPIPNNTTQRTKMEGFAYVSVGMHELRIRIRRPFRSLPQDQAPKQYLDNIQLKLSSS